jgi:hypothetical protein
MTFEENTKSEIARETQRGAALIVAIFAILLVTVIGFAMVSSGMISLDVARNSREQTEAYYISEAGLEHGARLVKTAGRSEFTNILRAGDGTANTGDELSARPSAQTPIPAAGLNFGAGRYQVFVSDDPADADGNPNADSNGRLVIRSVGTGQNGATVTTEVIIAISGSHAMLINGNLKMNGIPKIKGSSGSVHANGNVLIDGIPCVDQFVSASSSVINAGSLKGANCAGSGTARQNQAAVQVPTYNIRSVFYSQADYILGAIGSQTGKVYDRAGNLLHNAVTSGPWRVGGSEWSWVSSGRKWVHTADTLQNGTFYSEGNMEVSGSFGTSAAPVSATLIAEGYIILTGSPRLVPKLQNFALMAGTDLQISGAPADGEQNYNGINYAGHQIKFSGTPSINGLVIAANLADTNSPGCGCNPIPLVGGYMEMSGTPTITYNGGLFGSGANVISWREVRY